MRWRPTHITWAVPEVQSGSQANIIMFKAIGTVIVLYAIANLMTPAFNSFQAAAVATFGAIETAADVTTQQLEAEMQTP